MTLISILERKRLPHIRSCTWCDEAALVATPEGLACSEHAVAHVRHAEAEQASRREFESPRGRWQL